jgi:4'-phosphopantetheinyl transferase
VTVVWWAAPVAPAEAPGLVALLDGHERDRLHRFRRPADQARYLAAHALVRLVLADDAGLPADALVFDRTCRCGAQHGKPVLPDGPGFSLTHAGELVGVAVHPGGDVGLDVEQVRELSDLPGMAAHVCSPRESAADADAFFTLWTRKEALLKAVGTGLATPMSAITLGPAGVLDWTGEDAPREPLWLADLRPGPGYHAAVAGTGARPAVTEQRGDDLLAAQAR